MAYLVSKYAKNDSLYPKDPKERAVVDQMMYFDAGTLYFNLIKCYVRIDLCSKIFKLILRPNPQYPPDILNEIDFSLSISIQLIRLFHMIQLWLKKYPLCLWDTRNYISTIWYYTGTILSFLWYYLLIWDTTDKIVVV